MNATLADLKAPFPYAGGKSRVADLVWSRLGDVDNYVEAFAGSLAVLLRRPAEHFADGYRVETANDLNHYLVNFWRAVTADPEKVAEYADWPVMEADLHARHKWLVRSAEAAVWWKRMAEDPEHYDAKIAGWWVWGACCWIGGQWCQDGATDQRDRGQLDSKCGIGVNPVHAESPTDWQQAPELSASRSLGRGVTAAHEPAGGRPNLADAYDIGRGVNGGGGVSHVKRRPELTDSGIGRGVCGEPYAGTCDARRAWLTDWMRRLADRLRLVRTCYGHWSRVCNSDSTLTRLGTTGVFLDPPYPLTSKLTGKKSRDGNLYATDKGADLNGLRDEVLDWCRRWGQDPQIRVALCCYEGDGYEPLLAEGWTIEEWEASGGYANQWRKGKGKAANAKRERILFSPGCVRPERTLFDDCL